MGVTAEELLMYQLRNPPVMSMALNKDHLYSMMHERMALAADRIEQLLEKNEALERELEAVYYDISMNAGET